MLKKFSRELLFSKHNYKTQNNKQSYVKILILKYDFSKNVKLMDKSKELKQLGQRIRELRIERKLSQAKLALKIFKDQQSIYKVEAGQFNPSYIYLLEICEGLEITIAELFKK